MQGTIGCGNYVPRYRRQRAAITSSRGLGTAAGALGFVLRGVVRRGRHVDGDRRRRPARAEIPDRVRDDRTRTGSDPALMQTTAAPVYLISPA